MSLLWSLPVSANRSALLRRLDLHLPSFELNSSWSRPQWPHHPGKPLEARWHDNDAFYTWAPNSLSIMIVNWTREGDKKNMLSTPERPTLRQARTWQQREQDQPTLLSQARCSQTCLKIKEIYLEFGTIEHFLPLLFIRFSIAATPLSFTEQHRQPFLQKG